MDGWLTQARALSGRGDLLAARAVVDAAHRADPADRQATVALVELCAAQGDWTAMGGVLVAVLQRPDSRCGNEAPAFDLLFPNDADVQLRIRQLSVHMSGNDRRERAALQSALRRFPFFLAPDPPGADEQAASAIPADQLAPFMRPSAARPDHLSMWQDWLGEADMTQFRGECVYLSQAVAYDPSNFGAAALRAAYRRQAEHARAIDRLGAMAALADDGTFGCLRVDVGDGAVFSRDQLDSVLELNFLAAHGILAGADAPCLLDIGAGYGRLVHRFLTLFSGARAYALDAVPQSSLLCARYLRHRAVLPRAMVGGMDCLHLVAPGTIDCATNVHSWSEVPLASTEAWLDELVRLRVPYLFFVASQEEALSIEQDHSRRPILPAMAERGFRLVAAQPKYGVAGSQALYPFAHYYLFARG